VRVYNRILTALDPRERRLLSDELRKLDRMLGVGLGKLSWSQKKAVEKFLGDCSRACKAMQALVAAVQRGRRVVAGRVAAVGRVELLGMDKSQAYAVSSFSAAHQAHLASAHFELAAHHGAIVATLSNLYTHFKDGTGEVRREVRVLRYVCMRMSSFAFICCTASSFFRVTSV